MKWFLIDWLFGLLAAIGMLGTAGLSMLGLLTVWYWFKPPRAPNDASNRINNVTSWWIGLTRPDVLGRAYKAFRNDVMDNIE